MNPVPQTHRSQIQRSIWCGLNGSSSGVLQRIGGECHHLDSLGKTRRFQDSFELLPALIARDEAVNSAEMVVCKALEGSIVEGLAGLAELRYYLTVQILASGDDLEEFQRKIDQLFLVCGCHGGGGVGVLWNWVMRNERRLVWRL